MPPCGVITRGEGKRGTPSVSAVRFGYIVNPLLDLQEQRDKLALAMRARLGVRKLSNFAPVASIQI